MLNDIMQYIYDLNIRPFNEQNLSEHDMFCK